MSLGHRAALLAVLLVPLISGAPRWSAARAVGGQEGINVTVEGILQLGEFHGPPNYGENPATDEVEHWYYLQLPAPISTQVPDMKWPAEFQGTMTASSCQILDDDVGRRQKAYRPPGHRDGILGSINDRS